MARGGKNGFFFRRQDTFFKGLRAAIQNWLIFFKKSWTPKIGGVDRLGIDPFWAPPNGGVLTVYAWTRFGALQIGGC